MFISNNFLYSIMANPTLYLLGKKEFAGHSTLFNLFGDVDKVKSLINETKTFSFAYLLGKMPVEYANVISEYYIQFCKII